MPMSHRPPRVSRLKDVAHLAGVSTATVSRILNDHGPASEEARNRVLRAAQELDYHDPDPAGHSRFLRLRSDAGMGLRRTP
jgi:DNA-binding LacI/PurR family transcriptional regulator